MNPVPGENINRDIQATQIASWKGRLATARVENDMKSVAVHMIIAESNVAIAEMLLSLGREITQTLTQLNQDVSIFSGRELDGD